MTVYRWGRYRKERKDTLKKYIIKDVKHIAEVREYEYSYNNGNSHTCNYLYVISGEPIMFNINSYDSDSIDNRAYQRVKDKAEELKRKPNIYDVSIVSGYFDPNNPQSFSYWLGGRAYYAAINYTESEYGWKTVFSHNEKGSKIDTVTSSNRNAYPSDGESGSYWYVYEGIANQSPTISGKDEDLGGFKAPFKRVFSVDDPDNNETLNVTVKLNSATIRTINNATKNESYEIDIDKTKFDDLELNKTNTIEITVTDTNGASAIRRYTFKKVNSNPIVTVTNSNLGEQNKPFNFSFKAADPDGDDITVKVYVDDVQVQDLGKVTPDQVKTIGIGKLDYAKLKNGEHRIKIEATDSFGAKGTGYITFTKKIDYCWYRLTKEVDAQPSAVVVNPLAELAKGAKLTVKVSLNAKDTNPIWEVVPDDFIGQKYNFKTKTKTADKWCIGVDIKIDRANTPEGMESYFYGFVGAYM